MIAFCNGLTEYMKSQKEDDKKSETAKSRKPKRRKSKKKVPPPAAHVFFIIFSFNMSHFGSVIQIMYNRIYPPYTKTGIEKQVRTDAQKLVS
jgi:hypothetical protein